jgi:hypothetical protein
MQGGPWFPRRPSGKALIALAAVIVGFVVLLAVTRPSLKGPPLATSCRTPAIALGKPAPNGSVPYSITGPAAGTYVVAVDAETVHVQGDSAVVTPAAAHAVAIRRGLSRCAAHGTAPRLPAGGHAVELFRDGVRVAEVHVS